MFFLII